MARVKETVSDVAKGYGFRCLGCGDQLDVMTEGKGALWTFNGDVERPTFMPSLLVTSGHYVAGHKPGSCWCTYNAEHPDKLAPFTCYVCHSFVTNGRIQFLGDCTHALAGQTVDLPELVVEPA